jgi:hypothetical protein
VAGAALSQDTRQKPRRPVGFNANLKCPATPVEGSRVRAGPFTGEIVRKYDVVNGRFRLHVGPYRDRATGLSQKIPWLLPKKYRAETVTVRGRRLAPRGGAFHDSLENVGFDQGKQVFPSSFSPPKAGWWC